MSDARWILLSWVLILGTWLAWPFVSANRSIDGAMACMDLTAFAAGILFRGIVDGRRRSRADADVLFDASVKDMVKAHRPGGGSDVDG